MGSVVDDVNAEASGDGVRSRWRVVRVVVRMR